MYVDILRRESYVSSQRRALEALIWPKRYKEVKRSRLEEQKIFLENLLENYRDPC